MTEYEEEKVSRNFSLLLKFYFLIARWIFKLIFALRLIHEFDCGTYFVDLLDLVALCLLFAAVQIKK